MNKGFKCVSLATRSEGKAQLMSYTLGSGRTAVEYKLNQWAKRSPTHGPLAVFSTEQLARSFLKSGGAYHGDRLGKHFGLFGCEYEPSSDTYLWDGRTQLRWLPEGTCLAERVRLTKRLPQ